MAWRVADYDDLDPFVTMAVATVLGAQARASSMMVAYLEAILSVKTGDVVKLAPPPAKAVQVAAIRGVAPETVYGRTASTLYWRLSEGDPFGVAADKAIDRAVISAQTDLQLARTHTVTGTLPQAGSVVGYQRVTDSDPCELCATAATNLYHTDDLMPIHNRCSCGVEPIIGQSWDQARDDQVSQLKELEAAGISNVKNAGPVEVQHHGELGPVLTHAGDRFRGPDDL